MRTKFIRIWTLVLSFFFIAATFEHNFSILRQYSSELMVYGINVAMWSKVVLVAGVDLSIFFAISYIIIGRGQRNIMPAQIILISTGLVSVSLNVYYMLLYAPADGGAFAQVIGVIIGVLIPSMVTMFGWMEGDLQTSKVPVALPHPAQTTKEVTEDKAEDEPASAVSGLELNIKEWSEKHPDWSDRKIARKVNCSHTTVGRVRRKYNL
ncbi:hypothetical protein [Acinetobacter sp.]|uniref:hypothetical protein n=1 Tax=Acinetobacter sp. TaxID=472 RepID=UPI003D014C66